MPIVAYTAKMGQNPPWWLNTISHRIINPRTVRFFRPTCSVSVEFPSNEDVTPTFTVHTILGGNFWSPAGHKPVTVYRLTCHVNASGEPHHMFPGFVRYFCTFFGLSRKLWRYIIAASYTILNCAECIEFHPANSGDLTRHKRAPSWSLFPVQYRYI